MKKITTKEIDEETVLLPAVIAEQVAEKAVGLAMANELDHWDNLNAEQRKELDERYIRECRAVEEYLVLRANTTYQHNLDFHKKVNGAGNKGRDYLYMFMHHWVGINEGVKTVVGSYRKIIANYHRDKKEFKAKANKA